MVHLAFILALVYTQLNNLIPCLIVRCLIVLQDYSVWFIMYNSLRSRIEPLYILVVTSLYYYCHGRIDDFVDRAVSS